MDIFDLAVIGGRYRIQRGDNSRKSGLKTALIEKRRARRSVPEPRLHTVESHAPQREDFQANTRFRKIRSYLQRSGFQSRHCARAKK